MQSDLDVRQMHERLTQAFVSKASPAHGRTSPSFTSARRTEDTFIVVDYENDILRFQ